MRGAAIAQWIRLRLPFCCPGFESQAHHLRFIKFIFELCLVEKTNINKIETGIGTIFFKKIKRSGPDLKRFEFSDKNL